MAAYRWEEINLGSTIIPHDALRAGLDLDGAQIYVGRAYHDGSWMPSKVVPIRNVAYVPYYGKEIEKNICQVLCGQFNRFEWVQASNGRVPPCSIEGGKTPAEVTLYIGRVKYGGAITLGKVHHEHKVCYISFGGKEIPVKDYEILIMRA